jgi:hypothetical protein
MDDATSTRNPICDTEEVKCNKSPVPFIATEATCHFCGAIGQVVWQFPRRGYG